MTTSSIVVELPPKPSYGAVELKEFIRKNTMRGFIYTVCLIILFFLVNFVVGKISSYASQASTRLAPIVKLNTENLAKEEEQTEAPPEVQQTPDMGTVAQAGTPVPVPDALIKPDQVFASVENQLKSSSQVGNLDFVPENVPVDDKPKVNINQAIESEPDPNEFQNVEQEPSIDLDKLQQKIEYPEMAKRIGIEGKVVIRVLVGKDGKPKKTIVEFSDSEMLNKSAQKAVMESVFTPAIQNKVPVTCWVSIPILFKLR